jgi:hypothetical protein
MDDDARLFEKYRPKITEVTVVDAAREYGEGNEIVSLAGQQTGLDAFILLLATDAETRGPFLLSAYVARELCAQLIAAGFGPSRTPQR